MNTLYKNIEAEKEFLKNILMLRMDPVKNILDQFQKLSSLLLIVPDYGGIS